MITVKVQPEPIYRLINELGDIAKSASRVVATSLVGVVRKRIHTDGVATDGAQIGTYSDKYMKVRTGLGYENIGVYKSGKKKGQPRPPAGNFSKGPRKGQPRPKYNRTSDTKVVASLTRKMENDFAVVAVGENYGLGYLNELSYDKSQWVEATYNGREIFSLTDEELEKTAIVLEAHIKNAIS